MFRDMEADGAFLVLKSKLVDFGEHIGLRILRGSDPEASNFLPKNRKESAQAPPFIVNVDMFTKDDPKDLTLFGEKGEYFFNMGRVRRHTSNIPTTNRLVLSLIQKTTHSPAHLPPCAHVSINRKLHRHVIWSSNTTSTSASR